MKNKILIGLYIPLIEKNYDIYIPVNKKIGTIKKLIEQGLVELTDNSYIIKEDSNFYSKDNGQIYDAYSLLINILNQSKKEIIIIDNYASKELFDIIKDINKNITIITKNIDEILIKKYKKQYNNINIIKSDIFHDRFIIIDNEILYHSGASFKDLGNKCFAINKIIDKDILNKLLLEINNHIVKP